MIRQRVNLRRAPWAMLTRALAVLFAVALVYGGVLNALLALKVAPSSVERVSGYHAAYAWLAGLHRSDFTTAVSLIAGFGGLLVFLFFLFLAQQSLPRPSFARTDTTLPSTGGATIVRPRAVERLAEVAANGNDRVVGVTGRLGADAINLDVGLGAPDDLVQTLVDVRRRVAEELERHHLSPMAVNVTLTGYEPTRTDPT
jgi:hypothetical protein